MFTKVTNVTKVQAKALLKFTYQLDILCEFYKSLWYQYLLCFILSTPALIILLYLYMYAAIISAVIDKLSVQYAD